MQHPQHPTLRSTLLAMLLPISTVALVQCTSPSSPSARSSDLVTTDASSNPPTSAAAQRAEDAVRLVDAAEVQAFLDNDPASLARLWSDEFVVTNPFNQFANKEQVLALVTSGVLAFTSYERHADYVHAYGDIVVVAGRETVVWAGKIPLAGQTSNLRYTAVWARHGSDWQEIARHANLIPAGGPGGPPLQ